MVLKERKVAKWWPNFSFLADIQAHEEIRYADEKKVALPPLAEVLVDTNTDDIEWQ